MTIFTMHPAPARVSQRWRRVAALFAAAATIAALAWSVLPLKREQVTDAPGNLLLRLELTFSPPPAVQSQVSAVLPDLDVNDAIKQDALTALAPVVLPVRDSRPKEAMVHAKAKDQAQARLRAGTGATAVPPSLPKPQGSALERTLPPHDEQAPSPALLRSSGLQAVGKQVRESSPEQRVEEDYQSALRSAQHGRQEEAVARLAAVLKAKPEHAMARQALIGLLLQQGRSRDVLALASEGWSIDPTHVGFAMTTARLQAEQGDDRAALETLELGLAHAMNRPDYRAFLAALLQREQRHSAALEHYQYALQTAPHNGIWWMGLAISLEAEGRSGEARVSYLRAKTSDALSPELQAFVSERLARLAR